MADPTALSESAAPVAARPEKKPREPRARGERDRAPAAKKNQAERTRLERAVRGLAVAVYLGITALCFAHELGPRVFWTMALPLIPVGFVLAGFHPWRKVCPLAFWGDLGRALKRGEQRKVGAWLERWFFVVTFGFLASMLVLRHVATNGDGLWLGGLLVGLGLAAALVNFVSTGKTWCNFVCPVGMVERIYTEPASLVARERNSQCIKCTACKKNCPDIDQENGYWKDLDAPARRFAFYAFPGLVTAFYTYYWLRYGDWEAYFSGAWTRREASLELLLGDGFFFLPQIPALLAAILTHAAFSLASFGLFALLERHVVARFVADAERRRHVTLTLAAFCAFNLFYLWAGAPSLSRLPGGLRVAAFLAPVVASAFLIKRMRRSRERYVLEKSVGRLLKKWPSSEPPPADPAEVVAWFKAHDEARGLQLEAYREAVRDALEDGIVSAAEHRLIERLRSHLGIDEAAHKKLMAQLSDDQRRLFDPANILSIEERAQREGYRVALRIALMRDATARELEAMRLEHGIDAALHDRIVDELRSDRSPLAARADELLRAAEALRETLRTVVAMDQVASFDFLVFALLAQQDLLLDRVVEHLVALADDADGSAAVVRDAAGELFVSDKAVRRAALERLREASVPELVARLEPMIVNRRPAPDATRAAGVAAELARLVESPDRYVRAGAIYALGDLELEAFEPCLVAGLGDEDALVRETSVYAAVHARAGDRRALLEPLLAADPSPAVRRAAAEAVAAVERGWRRGLAKQLVSTGRGVAPPVPDAVFSELSSIERILFLRSVPLLAALDPDELCELTTLAGERVLEPGQAVCVQGELSRELYVIVAGSARVSVAAAEAGEAGSEVATLGPGDHFGELAALDGSPRSATVRASGDDVLRLLVIDAQVFRARLVRRPEVALKLMRTVAGRLRERLGAAL